MAKKKLGRTNENQTEQDLPQQDPPAVHQSDLHTSAMEESEAKLSKLKSLNEMLLKETTERRKEVSGLIESKKALEGELSRSCSEIEDLRLELARVRDSEAENVVAKDVVSAFVESKVGGELERLRERSPFLMGIRTHLSGFCASRQSICRPRRRRRHRYVG